MTIEDERLDLAFKASNEGIWDWDIASGEIFYTNRLMMFLEFGRIAAPNIFTESEENVHPDDLEKFQSKLDRVILHKRNLFAVEARVQTFSTKEWKWFRIRGVPVRDESGNVTRMVGSLIDISKRRFAQAALVKERKMVDLVFDGVPVNVFFKDHESRYQRANLAAAERFGLSSVKELVGKTNHDLYEKKFADATRAEEVKILESGEGGELSVVQEFWEDGRVSWAMVMKRLWRQRTGEVLGVFGMSYDVTEEILAQKNLEKVLKQLQILNEDISEERHMLRLVIDNVPMLVYFKNLDGSFALVNKKMAEIVGADLPDELVGKHNRDYVFGELLEKAERDEEEVIRTGKPLENDLEKISWREAGVGWMMTSKYPWYDADGKIRGTFGVSSEVTVLIETQNKLKKLKEDLGEQNEEMEKELNLAREIQQAALPSEIPSLQGSGIMVDFHHCYEPASALAGDFFNVFQVGDEKMGFFVCDVMGHGIRSALIVSMLRGLSEKQRAEQGANPGQFLTGLNDGLTHLLERTDQLIFATAIYGVVDLAEGELRLAVAGHPDPVVRRAGKTEFFEVPITVKGPALGMVPSFAFQEIVLPLAELEGFWAFTDGIFEVLNKTKEEFGPERMKEAMEQAGKIDQVIEAAVLAARDFSETGDFGDDVCFLGLEFSRRS